LSKGILLSFLQPFKNEPHLPAEIFFSPNQNLKPEVFKYSHISKAFSGMLPAHLCLSDVATAMTASNAINPVVVGRNSMNFLIKDQGL
jgi:hypothetical protein